MKDSGLHGKEQSLSSVSSKFLHTAIFACYDCSQIFELATLYKDLLPTFRLWFYPACYSWDM